MTVQRQISKHLFDPTCGVLIAQDSRPGGRSCISPEVLSPLQRSLMLIDGTVTKFLEACLLEPVPVMRLEQSNRVLDQEDQWLQAPAGSEIVRWSLSVTNLPDYRIQSPVNAHYRTVSTETSIGFPGLRRCGLQNQQGWS